jgi:predicted NUDIX family phosphoesterase
MNRLRKCNIYIGVLFSHQEESAIKKNETKWFEGKWMQLEDITLSEVSQTQKDRGYMLSLICGR